MYHNDIDSGLGKIALALVVHGHIRDARKVAALLYKVAIGSVGTLVLVQTTTESHQKNQGQHIRTY